MAEINRDGNKSKVLITKTENDTTRKPYLVIFGTKKWINMRQIARNCIVEEDEGDFIRQISIHHFNTTHVELVTFYKRAFWEAFHGKF